MKIKRLLVLIPILVFTLLFGIYLFATVSTSKVTTITETVNGTTRDYLEKSSVLNLQSFEICPSNCLYPSPFVEGYIYINYSYPLYSMQVLINGIGDAPRIFTASGPDAYAYLYKGSTSASIAANQTYTITVNIMFYDNSTYTASTNVIAD
jgi:hypothetical protein